MFVDSVADGRSRRDRGLPPLELTEMKLILTDGRVLSGEAVIGEIGRYLWWARPLAWLARKPLTRPAMAGLYRLVARNRHRLSRLLGYQRCTDACGIRPGEASGG